MLNSYTNTSVGSAQYEWLRADLAKVDRSRTPWVVAAFHCPWYNSNDDHQDEFQALAMQVAKGVPSGSVRSGPVWHHDAATLPQQHHYITASRLVIFKKIKFVCDQY